MSIEELRAQMAKDAKRDALKCLRSSSQQLGKASYEIDKLIEEFQRTRIPVRRQAIVNQAIEHLVQMSCLSSTSQSWLRFKLDWLFGKGQTVIEKIK